MTHYIYRTEHGHMILPVSARGESRWERRERRRRVWRVVFEVVRNFAICAGIAVALGLAAIWYCEHVHF